MPSPLAGVISHYTDQQGGKVQGQVKLANISSKVSPEIKIEPQARLSILILGKAYPTIGIYFQLLDMQGFWLERFVLPKSNKEYK